MPLTKTYLSDTAGSGTGLTLYHRIRLFPSGLILDHTDGVFRANPANDKVPALEVTIANGFPADMPGWFQTDENRTVHPDGIQVFELISASGVQYAGGGVLEIKDDADVLLGSRSAPSDILATPENKLEGAYLDARVSERARPSDILVDPETDKIDGSNLDAQVSLTAKESSIHSYFISLSDLLGKLIGKVLHL
jgi:hypothetical protein